MEGFHFPSPIGSFVLLQAVFFTDTLLPRMRPWRGGQHQDIIRRAPAAAFY